MWLRIQPRDLEWASWTSLICPSESQLRKGWSFVQGCTCSHTSLIADLQGLDSADSQRHIRTQNSTYLGRASLHYRSKTCRFREPNSLIKYDVAGPRWRGTAKIEGDVADLFKMMMPSPSVLAGQRPGCATLSRSSPTTSVAEPLKKAPRLSVGALARHNVATPAAPGVGSAPEDAVTEGVGLRKPNV